MGLIGLYSSWIFQPTYCILGYFSSILAVFQASTNPIPVSERQPSASWPQELSPQPKTWPSSVNTKVCSPPQATAFTRTLLGTAQGRGDLDVAVSGCSDLVMGFMRRLKGKRNMIKNGRYSKIFQSLWDLDIIEHQKSMMIS